MMNTTVAEWVEFTTFHVGPSAPNGSVAGRTERTLTYRRLFAADYYGKGEKLYLASHSRYQTPDGHIGPAFAFTQDGDPDRITATISRVGVSI